MQEIKLDLSENSYNIYVGRNLLNDIPKMIHSSFQYKKVFIITDDNVSKLYLKSVKNGLNDLDILCYEHIIPAGESSKSMEELSNIYDALIEHRVTRKDLIIALGGGVVGDLAGFAAATYLRGIDFIQVPTTLLSQVDSSVGGKVAINVKQGKNLVGNFYHPKAVYVDVDVLRTLDDKEMISGMAEVIKYAFIKDRALFDLLKIRRLNNLEDKLTEIVSTCIQIKADIVERDEKESFERMLLNFGHTVGHAIEKKYDYKKYTHGEAVGMGIRCMINSEYRAGIIDDEVREESIKLLDTYGLEMNEVFDMDELVEYMKLDKKSLSNSIQVILIKKIGESYIKEVSYNWLSEFLKEGLC